MFAMLALAGMLATPGPSAPVATSAPTPIVNTFGGVTLGDSRDAARKSLGKPLEVDPVNVGEMVVFGADGGNARLSVIFASDAATSITFRAADGKKSTLADPFGVSLGMTVDQLTSLRGQPVTVAVNGNRVYGDVTRVRWVYGFDSGQITDINVSQPVRSATPVVTSLDESNGRDGSNIDHAIMVNAPSTSAGTDLEYRYVKSLTCSLGGAWNVVTQTTLSVGARWFDEFDLTCSTDKTTRKLYFDITVYATSR